ncbi:hypothetical protein C8Q75DRAFT_721587 [Abortiporus biennis]|nr:hypothetical protein C8Q75DRAFT_721587 [Abortiporus biennis]
MTSAPTRPVDVPPYQVQSLLTGVFENLHGLSGAPVKIRCAQALGSEIYVGCSNGELLRFALQANSPNSSESYTLLSRQSLPNDKPAESIVVVPSISRALVLSNRQVHFYTIPALDPVSPQVIKPIRNVVTFAVDEQHLRRPAVIQSNIPQPVEPVEFCIIKRSSISLYSLLDRLSLQKEIPLQTGASISLARRSGRFLCLADKENYNVIDLNAASMIPLMPLSQAFDSPVIVKPSITVVSDHEFLILSWTGSTTLGLFITGEGDPVRGTLEWPDHPQAVCLDYPYITTLLPNGTIEIHSVETQSIVQVVPAPSDIPTPFVPIPVDRLSLVYTAAGYLVPSSQSSDKLRKVPVRLLRGGSPSQPAAVVQND